MTKAIKSLSVENEQLAGYITPYHDGRADGKLGGITYFEKLGLYTKKKTKTGYPTDVDTLKKLRFASPIIDKILDYRTYAKLNSTYVEGLIPCINKDTKRIHSTFMQTITATGRISSTEPNLQNIPTRGELGKNIRKIDAPECISDYQTSQNNIYHDLHRWDYTACNI